MCCCCLSVRGAFNQAAVLILDFDSIQVAEIIVARILDVVEKVAKMIMESEKSRGLYR